MEESAVEPVSVMSVPVQDGTQVVEEMVEEMQMLPQTRLLSSAEGGSAVSWNVRSGNTACGGGCTDGRRAA